MTNALLKKNKTHPKIKGWQFLMVAFLVWSSLGHAQNDPKASSMNSSMNSERLSEDIQSLKEKVFKTKAQVHELRDNVLRGSALGSKAYIEFKNNAEGLFTLESVEFWLDGEPIYKVAQASQKEGETTLSVFDDALASGAHEIKVKAVYKGSRKKIFSAFEYFKGQKVELEKTEKFFVDFGKTTVVNVATLDKGYFKDDGGNRLQMNVQVIQNWGVE